MAGPTGAVSSDSNLTVLNRFNSADEAIDIAAIKYLTFLLAGEYYAFSIRNVVDIVVVQEITMVPEFPEYVKGIIDLRGRIIPIVDVRTRFHLKAADYTERTCIIVIDIGGIELGFLVDTVDAVIDIEPSSIAPPPTMGGSAAGSKFLAGVAKTKERVVLILDADKLLNRSELQNIASNVNN